MSDYSSKEVEWMMKRTLENMILFHRDTLKAIANGIPSHKLIKTSRTANLIKLGILQRQSHSHSAAVLTPEAKQILFTLDGEHDG